ncbi:MAG: hypothetical protein N4A35_09470 [Flavobacteriales bacterium]|nr:hypothetical protein [Flavobacteriales bacterium]
MKEQNDIDQLFKSKLNQKSFELKDSYLADFEQKLDAHNKKGKGAFWFIFGALVAFTCLYDFSILPQFNHQSHYIVEELKEIDFQTVEHESTTLSIITASKHLETSTTSTNELNTAKETVVKKTPSPYQTTALNNGSNSTTQRTKKHLLNKKAEKVTSKKSIMSDGLSNSVTKKENANGISTTALDTLPILHKSITPATSTPDVYLDDTIRRQVVIIDTIVKRDTVVINDTIKHRIRLFKKKR